MAWNACARPGRRRNGDGRHSAGYATVVRSTAVLLCAYAEACATSQGRGSVSATLPKEMADRLNVAAGDDVFVVETRMGSS
jgi:hypothetical protein